MLLVGLFTKALLIQKAPELSKKQAKEVRLKLVKVRTGIAETSQKGFCCSLC